MAAKKSASVIVTKGVKMRAMTGEILLTRLAFVRTKNVAKSGTEGKIDKTK